MGGHRPPARDLQVYLNKQEFIRHHTSVIYSKVRVPGTEQHYYGQNKIQLLMFGTKGLSIDSFRC